MSNYARPVNASESFPAGIQVQSCKTHHTRPKPGVAEPVNGRHGNGVRPQGNQGTIAAAAACKCVKLVGWCIRMHPIASVT